MFSLTSLKCFAAAAEELNFTRAAKRLFISQPSLSTAIHNLEKEMGVTAFVRSNKGVTVTREGEEIGEVGVMFDAAERMATYEGKKADEGKDDAPSKN